MLQILDHKTVPVNVRHDDGTEGTVEAVHTVSFIDHSGALRGLTFHPRGTNVAGETEEHPRIVGEDVPHYLYTDPEKAVTDYENGRIA